MILCIDPGVKKAGVALFEPDGKLMTAWLAEGKDWRDTADCVMRKLPVSACNVSAVVIEKMQIYDSTPLAHANDCITVALMAGRVTGLFSGWVGDHTFEYYPNQWKGQVPKKIMIGRIKRQLTTSETNRVQNGASHDVWDAIGIGLHHLRSKRGRVENLRRAVEEWNLRRAVEECIYEHKDMTLCMKCGWQNEG